MATKGGVVVIVSGEDKTGEVFAAVKKHLDETQAKAKETSSALGEIGEVLQRGLEVAGIAVGLREAVGGLKEMIQSSMEAGVEIGRLREETGISAENLSILKYAAASTGTSFEALTKGFKNISTMLHEAEDGDKKAIKAFADLGISVTELRNKGNDLLGVLQLVARKFEEMPAGPLKNAVATELFKRSGQDLIPVLNELNAALEEGKKHAAIFTDEDIDKMKKMHEATADLDAEWQKFSLTMASFAAPGLTGMMKELSSGHATRDALTAFLGGWNPLLYTIPDAPTYKPKPPSTPPGWAPPSPPTAEEIAKQKKLAEEMARLQEQLGNSLMQLREAIAKQSEAQARTEAQTLLDINEQAHKDGLIEETVYLKNKAFAQNTAFNAEITALQSQQKAITDSMAGISEKSPGTEKGRIEQQIKFNSLQRELMQIEDKLAEVEERRAKAAGEMASETKAAYDAISATISLPDDTGSSLLDAFKSKAPNVVLDPLAGQIENESEKLAHGLFDPLFNFGEKWSKQWKQIRENLLRDMGELAESQIFGVLFGDSSGRGGKGWVGGQGDAHRSGVSGVGGLVGDGLSAIEGLFTKKSSIVSNGSGAAGAGTVMSAAASALQIGKGGAGPANGTQVIINNLGQPATVDSTQQSGGDGVEPMILQIILKDQTTNGPITQGFAAMFNG